MKLDFLHLEVQNDIDVFDHALFTLMEANKVFWKKVIMTPPNIFLMRT